MSCLSQTSPCSPDICPLCICSAYNTELSYIVCNTRTLSAAALWVENVVGAGSCNFLTDNYKFPTEEIIGARNFNSAPKFLQNGEFPAPSFVCLDENFPTRSKLSGKLKLKGDATPAGRYCSWVQSEKHEIADDMHSTMFRMLRDTNVWWENGSKLRLHYFNLLWTCCPTQQEVAQQPVQHLYMLRICCTACRRTTCHTTTNRRKWSTGFQRDLLVARFASEQWSKLKHVRRHHVFLADDFIRLIRLLPMCKHNPDTT